MVVVMVFSHRVLLERHIYRFGVGRCGCFTRIKMLLNLHNKIINELLYFYFVRVFQAHFTSICINVLPFLPF